MGFEWLPFSGCPGEIFPGETYVSDHYERMISRMTDQFKITEFPDGTFEGPEQFRSYIRARANRIQAFEDAVYSLITWYPLDVAFGWILDVYGRHVGLRRSEWGATDDNEYRRMLRVKIAVNACQGSYQEYYDICRAIVDGENYCQITQYTPNSVQVITDGEVFNDSFYANMIDLARGDIAAFSLVIAVPDTEIPFRFAANGSYYDVQATAGNVAWIDIPVSEFIDGATAHSASGGVNAGIGLAEITFTGTQADADLYSTAVVFDYSGDTGGGNSAYQVRSPGATLSGVTVTVPVEEAIAAANFDGVLNISDIEAGQFADGQIVLTDGTSSPDLRTLDGSSPVKNAANWRFTPTAVFAPAPDGTTYANVIVDSAGACFTDSESELDIAVVAGDSRYIDIAAASIPAVIAGDLALAQIAGQDGTGINQLRTVNASGAVASGANWRFTIIDSDDSFDPALDATSVVNLLSGGGKLGRVIV